VGANSLPRRILLIGSSSGMGLTFYFSHLALQMKARGNEVVVLSDIKLQYPVLSKELQDAGIEHYTSDSIDYSNPIKILKGIRDLKAILRKEEFFDIIHQCGAKHAVKSFVATKSLVAEPKTFSTVTSLPVSIQAKTVAALAFNMFCNKSIALCNYTYKEMVNYGVRPDKIVTLPLFAPDLNWYDSIKKEESDLKKYGIDSSLISSNRPIVFYAASHYLYKGFFDYLVAAKEVLKSNDCVFLIGGRGPMTPRLRHFATMLGIQKNVVFTGWISQYEMPSILSKVPNICVSSSLRDQLPSYILECMAASKPVIATRVGGCPEAIEDEISGLIISPGKPQELAKNIIKLINNPDQAAKMGKEGRRRIEQLFNTNDILTKLEHAYDTAIQEK
jgi:glycosyltransferase involved in cell wall biosynthesis